ncbi:MAG: glucose 1-dehydrogenase [Hyphomicrobiaceae bacterium]|nr:glucose 1-dehydrogenase [Hyphomicrobiaceae bacterium]
MARKLEGKAALVTGAAHGIGAAIARRLADDGARVLLADIDGDAAGAIADAITAAGGIAQSISMDVRDRERVAAGVERAVSLWGRLDILVANAGIVDRAPFLEMDDDLWSRVIDTNLRGAFYCGQFAARQMVKQGGGGRIVNVASNSGIFGGRGRAAYGASKAGIINLTQTMAIELAEHGILVNAVAPGATKTRVTSGDTPPATVMARMPLARYGQPEEIAAVAAFLASDECSFTTGHVFCADGGFTVAGVMEG